MKLIEHLEHVIRLVDRPASPAEIKGALLAMHQEVEGYEQRDANASSDRIKLAEENAKLRATIDRFGTASKIKLPRVVPPMPRNIV